jgi:hypothetical protein
MHNDDFDCSHALRLSGRDWLLVGTALLALIGLGPILWERFDAFEPGPDYRIPYELSSDYWLYGRYNRHVCGRRRILVVGDSVIWGHYVPPNETLTHYLNDLAGQQRFVNLGLDGAHPAALEGLLRYFGPHLCGQLVLLHFNPLWISSARHDLQTDKEFHFNHPDLVSQFAVPIPCYKAPLLKRTWISIRRTIPFSNWVSHLRIAYYDGLDIPRWTLRHPYSNPLAPLARGLPESAGIPEPVGRTWVERGARKQDLAWVDLETSLQWRFFRRSVALLHEQANQVFVLVGPFNEHLLTDSGATVYNTIKDQISAWLQENEILHFVAEALPAEHYVDTSHPIGEGYALLAGQLLEQPPFRALAE